MTCRNYRTDVLPGSQATDAQPFAVEVGVGAAVMVDLHSHFTKCEVIGYLAGKWDSITRKIIITRAFPGITLLQGSDAMQEAEMDPVSEVVLRSKVESCGLQVVGWYHSPLTEDPAGGLEALAKEKVALLKQDGA